MIYIQRLSELPGETPCSDVRKEELSRISSKTLSDAKRGTEAALWRAFSERYPGEPYPFDYPRDRYGKPYFEQYPDFQFSLSHTWTIAACGCADRPCGLDIERVGRVGELVIKRVYSQKERDYIYSQPMHLRGEAAAIIWCMREAYGKMIGVGVLSLTPGFYALPDGECSDEDCAFHVFAPDTEHAIAFCVRGGMQEKERSVVYL